MGMLMHMRTTIVIDDALFRQARKRATELKTTLSGLIEAALRGEFAARPQARAKRKPFKLHVNKGPGLVPGHSWDRVARQVLDSDPNGLP